MCTGRISIWSILLRYVLAQHDCKTVTLRFTYCFVRWWGINVTTSPRHPTSPHKSTAGVWPMTTSIEETFMLFGMRHQEFSYLWSFGEVSFNFRVQYILSKSPMPSGKNLVDSAGNPWGWWFLVKGIYMEIWVVNKTRTHGKVRQNF